MPVAALTTLDALIEHFDRDQYLETLLTCANKRTDRDTLLKIYNRFFRRDGDKGEISDMKGNGMDSEDLGQIMQYKLSRGKWRPRLQQLIESNDGSEVRRVTLAALSDAAADDRDSLTMQELQRKMTGLCVLKAVGPATASLILSVFYDSAPFFSDEFAAFHPTKDGAKLKYTLKEYTDLVERHRSWLGEQQESGVTRSQPLTSRDVEEMIWYHSRTAATDAPTTQEKPSTRKRGITGRSVEESPKKTRRI
ncbi:protein of unknown function [Taphrina deformans PYCC 5710]|uniref:Uncharacterized protein n=1 Tax=Taphrina deformans (strain PYCC 5710 / ATCC 11124 / CBS 356.35 / IMI 108563 / JCM 9778 / NBRC 8474) TaxID=1097556 RepID=R4XDC9_TAPDE|nr:protein of unknown function [Taphrina deformans PYCC 5710]|eukprot:CCG82413.1 protein of unknown function [Taphrina deformans PYCC 5710]